MKKAEIQALKDSINNNWIPEYKGEMSLGCALCKLHRGDCIYCIIFRKTGEFGCSEFKEFKDYNGGKEKALAVIKRLISWLPKEHRAEFKEWEDK
jgi:hypothetical protein